MDKWFLTENQLRDLANRLRDAYREACESGECDCITTEEHERMLASSTRMDVRRPKEEI